MVTSSKNDHTFTGRPNPYNGFDRASSFPVTVLMDHCRWTDASKKVLTPSKGSTAKVTGVITSVYPDSNGVNHWVVSASEIFFLKDTPSPSKPVVPGTGKVLANLHLITPLTFS